MTNEETIPVLHNVAKVLNTPEDEEAQREYARFAEAKRPAEELRLKQMQWERERHGTHP